MASMLRVFKDDGFSALPIREKEKEIDFEYR